MSMHVINMADLDERDNRELISTLRESEENEDRGGEKILAFGLLLSLNLCLFTLSLCDLSVISG